MIKVKQKRELWGSAGMGKYDRKKELPESCIGLQYLFPQFLEIAWHIKQKGGLPESGILVLQHLHGMIN